MDSYGQFQWEYEWFLLEQEDKQIAAEFCERVRVKSIEELLVILDVLDRSVATMKRILRIDERRARRLTLDMIYSAQNLASNQQVSS